MAADSRECPHGRTTLVIEVIAIGRRGGRSRNHRDHNGSLRVGNGLHWQGSLSGLRKVSALPSQLHLNVFITGAGHHEASWRLPGTAPERVDDVHYFREIAQTAERGKFDSIFFADVPAVGRHYDRVAQSSF